MRPDPSTGEADPWAVLGLRRGASAEEVARAWRALAARHHPDTGGDAGRFREVVAARDRIAGLVGAGSRNGGGGHVAVVRRPSAAARVLRPLRRRIDRRLHPRVH